ncbi:two component transcriptional regulator, winged helix family [Candidatus Rhodobacter oscarellae]|uniref:Two component transcriptional regulator, winged helix family n=1 Tax=Candidatus Rhodobacter oscarellae TaxID=1675527 RepID=A0A0J9EDX2_9RHOB|nr:response regulator transcription factor [Candidatus Rhodobacter lobularis]KMW59934.1 two component transcriptional regulator, winged helix family [Candidatus Rhodobacter lobularis]
MQKKSPKTILIVDDEAEIRSTLTSYLTGEGFEVEAAADGAEMADCLAQNTVDLVLLDLGLRNESGLDLLKKISAETDIAVVILTGKSDPIERVVGLELGADDYIVKPFLQRELLARINAVLRRAAPRPADIQPPAPSKPRQLRVNNWNLDMQLRLVETNDGTRIDLTGTEFELLAVLANNVGEAMSRDQLSMAALNRAWDPSDRSVDIHIYNLRRKLARTIGQDDSIVTVRNYGYTLAAEVHS